MCGMDIGWLWSGYDNIKKIYICLLEDSSYLYVLWTLERLMTILKILYNF